MGFRWTIGKKLGVFALSCGVVLLGLAGVAGRALRAVEDVSDELAETARVTHAYMTADMMHDALRADVLEALISAQASGGDGATSAQEVDRHAETLRSNLAAVAASPIDAGTRASLEGVRGAVDAYAAEAQALTRLAVRDRPAAAARYAAFGAAAESLEPRLAEVSSRLVESAERVERQATDTRFDAERSMAVAVVLALAIVAAAGAAWVRRITTPLRNAVALVRSLAEGDADLTKRLPGGSSDELGDLCRSFNDFMDKLEGWVGETQRLAAHVAGATGELTAGTDQLSRGAQRLASAVEQTSAGIEEIRASVSSNAANATEADRSARASREIAEGGGRLVAAAIAAMGEIDAAATEIGGITSTIDELAFQTNLLALNAAVEAARAGEQGRGFAVVAAEVRALAQRSAAAARRIKSLVGESARKVDAGSARVHESGRALDDIVASVRQVTELMARIAVTSQDQAQGVSGLASAMSDVGDVAQSTASQAEELTATSRALLERADEVHALIGRLRLREAPGAEVAVRVHRRLAPPARERLFATAS
jgi:methyl-accepting chemotaxis protein